MIAILLALSIAANAAPKLDTTFSSVVVRPRQTASWLAFRHLGAFDRTILDTLKLDNPTIPDLAKLKGGETLRIRRSMDRRPLSPARQIEMASRNGVVTTIKGPGELRRASGELLPLSVNTFLAVGDEIRTGPAASAEIVIDNQSVLRLRENSRLRLLGIQDSASNGARKSGTRVALETGALWVKVRKWAGPLVGFDVRLPSTIAGVHGTIFEATIGADSTESVYVVEGIVSVREQRAGGLEVKLERGQKVSTRPGGALGAPSASRPSSQPWPAELLDLDSESKIDAKARYEIVDGLIEEKQDKLKLAPPEVAH
jgi:ferric-dicitrate binding protein FerR (iron transport regulator)